MGKIIGIDLGTTNTCASVFEGNSSVIIINNEGKRTTPSVVGFLKDGERKVGDPAKRQAITNPLNTIYSIKRLMGEAYEKVRNDIEKLPYSIVNENGYPRVEVDGRKYSPQEISAIILRKIKKDAEAYLGQVVTEAVITVPAYFNMNQRQATKEAGIIAGLNVRRIISEPTAAALAYGIGKSNEEMKVAVFDFGGGTFDISVLEFGGGVFEVLSTSGDTHLGGDDFDNAIIDWIVGQFERQERINLKKDSICLMRLKDAAEKAKMELSNCNSTEVNLPYLTVVNGVPKHFVATLTRTKFEQLIQSIISRCLVPCKTALADAGLSTTDIDKVILVGGSSRIPAVQDFVKKIFGKNPLKSINPDEAVAIGAGVQGVLCHEEQSLNNTVILDVTPFSLGIETFGGVMTKLIPANCTIPCKKTEVFSTAADNQTEVTIHVIQGERPMASQNNSIGQFTLSGIIPAKKGVPQIEVIFEIDANGLLKVSAKDKATGNEQKIQIESSSALSHDELNRMRVAMKAQEHNHKRVNRIFISYKRVNKDSVFRIKEQIESAVGEKCWIDLEGIESDAQFANVIIKAINEADIFLFMYSKFHSEIKNHESDWTVREISFADKKNKRIIFINIDGTHLSDWFELMFGTKQQIDASSEFAVKKLCKDLTKWLSS